MFIPSEISLPLNDFDDIIIQPIHGNFIFMRLLILAIVTVLTGHPADFSGRCTRVVDGDTLVVSKNLLPVRVRLNGIDAPESKQVHGAASRRFVAALALDNIVKVIHYGQDRYGRTLGDVILPDGRNLNHVIVEAGCAWHYKQYSRDNWLAMMEAQARMAKRGLWADADPVAPWVFRSMRLLRGGRL